MLAAFVIMLRETLEAALVIGIISGFLIRIEQKRYLFQVSTGGLSGIIASLIGAYLFTRLTAGFSGKTEELFEGVTMIFGALLLTTMILWMMNQRNIARDIERQVSKSISKSFGLGVFFLSFIAILREGVESVIFLAALRFTVSENTLLGALLGIAAAIVLGYLFFFGSLRIDIRKFFTVTSVLLILFAAGLFAHGIHELQEAGVIPVVVEHVWDINPSVVQDGIYPLLHENGHVGGILKGLFGYNGNPSLLEVVVYIVYLAVIFMIWWVKNNRYGKPGPASIRRGGGGETLAATS